MAREIIRLVDEWGIGKDYLIERDLDKSVSLHTLNCRWVAPEDVKGAKPHKDNPQVVLDAFEEWLGS